MCPSTWFIYLFVFFHAFPPKITLGPCQWVGVGVGVHLWAWPQGHKVTYSGPTGETIVGSQCVSRVLPVAFQCSSSVFRLCKLTMDRDWVLASASVVPVASQCTCGSSGLPVCSIHANNTGSPLEHQWVLASVRVVLVVSQCTCSSSGHPVWSVQWYPNVLTESGLGVIRSGHYPACDPLCTQLVWWELFELNWFHMTCNPKYTKTIMVLISKACTGWCWSTHMY